MSTRVDLEEVPQGLKPATLSAPDGTAESRALSNLDEGQVFSAATEAVPFPNSFDRPAGVKEIVKQKYGEAALRVTSGGSSCCGAAPGSGCDPITTNLYDVSQAGQIPEEALLASLG
jgi:hypothetical protein